MKNIVKNIIFLLSFLAVCSPAATPLPNIIIIILADDLGYGDLGSYGASLIETPRLDALAQQGVRLTDISFPRSCVGMHTLC